MRNHSKRLTLIIVLLLVLTISNANQNIAAQNDFDIKKLGLLWERDDGHNATLWSVRWSPDGSMISATFFDNTTVVWNSTDGRRIIKLGAHANYTPEPEGVRCWGSKDCKIDNIDHWPSRMSAWSPDGQYLAVGGDNRLVVIYETTDWTIEKILGGHEGSVLSVGWSPDGSMIASGSGTDKVDMHNIPENTIKIWDFVTGATIINLTGHEDGILDVKWSSDGSKLVSASDDKTLKLWNTATWDNTLNYTGHTIGVLSVDWSPNETMLVSGSRDYTIRVWNTTTGEQLSRWSAPNCQRSVDWHLNGELIAASGPAESLLKIRNATTGTVLKTYEEAAVTGSDVMSARWSPDGYRLAAGAGKEHTLRVYMFGISTEPPTPLVPEWLPGTTLFFVLSTVGTFLIVWWVVIQLRKKRKKEAF